MHNSLSAAKPAAGFKIALELIAVGDHEGAARLCSIIGAGDPDYAAAQHLLGLIAYQRDDLVSALDLLSRAVAEKPFNAAYQSDLGLVRLARHEYEMALNCFLLSIEMDGRQITPYNNGGLTLLAMKRPDEAVDWFKRALAIDPKFAPAHLNMGLAHRDRMHPIEARASFETALAIDPDFAKAHFLLGDLSQSQKDLPEAVRHFKQAIRAKSDYLAAYNRLAICLAESNCFDEANYWMSMAASKFPGSAETFCNYGNILRLSHDFVTSLEMYRRAIQLKPEWPEAHFNHGLMHLLLGNFEEGWPEFEWRLHQFPPESGYPNRHGLPLWQGEPLRGQTILVYDEQGFGDIFLFMRYLPLLKKSGARVVVETRSALLTIFRKWPHVDEVVPRHPQIRPETTCDYCIPLASLPGRMGTRLETIPADVPYFSADPDLKAHWARRMKKGAFKIGVVWSGSTIDVARRLDLELLAPLAELKAVGLYGLQKPNENMAPGMDSNCPWLDNLGPELRDFSDTAAAIANCDLILTIDTAVAHLAGAMAARVWVLLPYIPDWRWFLNRDDSPWYPTMRLFRQQQPGQWTLPICKLLVELKRLVESKFSPWHPKTQRRESVQKSAEAFFKEAISFQANSRIDEAIVSYEQASSCDPTFAEAYYNLGILYYQQNRWFESADCFRSALSTAPVFAHAAFNLAIAYERCNLPSAAVSAYRQALAISPGFGPAAYNLGLLLISQGQYPEAIAAFRQAVESDPNHWEAHNNLGLACHHAGRLDEAIAAFEKAIRIKPDYVKAYQNLGNVFMDQGCWDKTIEQYRQALDLHPHDPMAQYAMGKLYLELPDLGNARDCFENAIALQPDHADAHYDLAQVLLMQEEYLTGWKHFRRRFECRQSRVSIYPFSFDLPTWDGSPFKDRTLLVHCEQGFGDTIQFARFLPSVKAMGGKVLFQVQPALLPLFKGFPGADELMVLTDRQPEKIEADIVVPLMNLPGCLQITAGQIPNRVPYLHAGIDETKRWRHALNPDTFNVGIVWSGNPMQVNNPRRACHPDDFLSLGTLPGIQLYSLQKNCEPYKNARLLGNKATIHLGDKLETFGETAAVIANMDLIITVDTSVAHLAGAMGCPVWILLSHFPDWRWGLQGTENVWYPTARLFRQPNRGDWGTVFEMLRESLIEYMGSRPKVSHSVAARGSNRLNG